VSVLSPDDFFRPISIIHTLLREGYSLRNRKFLSEVHRFSSVVMFRYELSGLKPSDKVRVVNILRGIGSRDGTVRENCGKWIANQVFILPIGREAVFEKFFLNFKIKFNKFYLLMH
jgi:hypothetical protein